MGLISSISSALAILHVKSPAASQHPRAGWNDLRKSAVEETLEDWPRPDAFYLCQNLFNVTSQWLHHEVSWASRPCQSLTSQILDVRSHCHSHSGAISAWRHDFTTFYISQAFFRNQIATLFLPTDQPSHPLQAAIENLSKWNPFQTTGQSYFLQALVEELTKGQSAELQWWNPNIQLLIEGIS